MKDLEIRGPATCWVGEQSGHIAGVGFDLYVRLVGEAVAEFRGETGEAEAVDVKVDLPVDANLPVDYLPGASCGSRPIARWPAPRPTKRSTRSGPSCSTGTARSRRRSDLLAVARFKVLARRYGVTEVVPAGRVCSLHAGDLPDSAQLRLRRLYDRSLYRQAVSTLSVPRPKGTIPKPSGPIVLGAAAPTAWTPPACTATGHRGAAAAAARSRADSPGRRGPGDLGDAIAAGQHLERPAGSRPAAESAHTDRAVHRGRRRPLRRSRLRPTSDRPRAAVCHRQVLHRQVRVDGRDLDVDGLGLARLAGTRPPLHRPAARTSRIRPRRYGRCATRARLPPPGSRGPSWRPPCRPQFVRLGNGGQPVVGRLGQWLLRWVEEVRVAPLPRSTDPAAYLVELGQAEHVGPLEGVGVGDVRPDSTIVVDTGASYRFSQKPIMICSSASSPHLGSCATARPSPRARARPPPWPPG